MLKTGASSWRLLAEVYPSGQKKTFQPADCGYSVWMLHFWVVQHWSLPISFADICEFGLAHGSFNFSNEHLWKCWLRDENLFLQFPKPTQTLNKRKHFFFREWSSNPQLVAGVYVVYLVFQTWRWRGMTGQGPQGGAALEPCSGWTSSAAGRTSVAGSA